MKHLQFLLWTVILPLPIGTFSLLSCLDPLLTSFPTPTQYKMPYNEQDLLSLTAHAIIVIHPLSLDSQLCYSLLPQVTSWFWRTFAIIIRTITCLKVSREVAPEKKLRWLLDYFSLFSSIKWRYIKQMMQLRYINQTMHDLQHSKNYSLWLQKIIYW